MHMSTLSSSSPSYRRLTEAALGFAVTALPLAAIGSAQFLLARRTVEVAGGMDPDIDTWAVAQFRSALTSTYAVVTCLVMAYWLLTATLGRGRILAIRSANVTLVLSGSVFGCVMVIASAVRAPTALLKAACPLLRLSDTYPKFGFDVPTACGAFAYSAFSALQILLLGLSALLLTTSVILRISLSRYR